MLSPRSVVVMEKGTPRAAKMRGKQKHEEKVQRVREILSKAGYGLGRSLYTRTRDIEFFLGPPGSVIVIAIWNDRTFKQIDILVPLDYSSTADDTLDALRKAVAS